MVKNVLINFFQKKSEKVLTSQKLCAIIVNVAERCDRYGSIAQLGEHMPYKHGVTGSSPVVPTIRPGSSVG